MKRILTVDDSRTMRDMLLHTLTAAGYEVVQAIDGEDGVRVLDEQGFDVIITDINMPKMDGYGFIEYCRRDDGYRSTPILVLTTETSREKRERAREAGATGWIVKPFDPQRLTEIIERVAR
ncbi:MAG: response regulator [Pseudomonadota bacterium]|nr:response regulator [Pseudomonadota bacterium]